MPSISVVIPAHNEEKYVGDCIESVLQHAPRELTEIVVVCNACTDRTADVALRYPKVKVIHEPRKGTGYARNTGFKRATGDILAYLDADSRIHADWFPMVQREFAANPSLVSLSGPCRFYDLPAWQGRVVYLWWMMCAIPEYYRAKFAILGANFAARRSALERVGGFDTSIPFWGDDTNIARRLRQVGDVKFTMEFYNFASARRLKSQGFVRTGTIYAINYLSQAYFQKSVTMTHGGRPWDEASRKRGVLAKRRFATV